MVDIKLLQIFTEINPIGHKLPEENKKAKKSMDYLLGWNHLKTCGQDVNFINKTQTYIYRYIYISLALVFPQFVSSWYQTLPKYLS